MREFLVLFDNGPDKPATRLTVYADSIETVREKFPTAMRVVGFVN